MQVSKRSEKERDPVRCESRLDAATIPPTAFLVRHEPARMLQRLLTQKGMLTWDAFTGGYDGRIGSDRIGSSAMGTCLEDDVGTIRFPLGIVADEHCTLATVQVTVATDLSVPQGVHLRVAPTVAVSR
jgi:hypothetical protein